MNGLLVIGYGNPLRGDDGAGPEAARRVERLGLPGVIVIECHQLLPEHAEALSRVARAVFVDAHQELSDGGIEVTPVKPAENPQIGSHASDPASLLALSKALYGHAPEASLIAIPTRDFELREGLSDLAAKCVEQAVTMIETRLAPMLHGRADNE
jgi:hydrogenase maturation protease